MIQAQIYREWGVAIVKGRAECLLALLECTVPNASPRSKVACGKSRDKLIERANVAHCTGGFAEAVLLRRRYALMKGAGRIGAARRLRPQVQRKKWTKTSLHPGSYLARESRK